MDDIKKANVDLKDDDGFVVKPLEDEGGDDERSDSSVVSEKVKVRFDKFVQLVAMHDFEKVLDKSGDEEVTVSTNLLTDLANAHNGREDRKISYVFVAGLIIGIVVTYLLVTR